MECRPLVWPSHCQREDTQSQKQQNLNADGASANSFLQKELCCEKADRWLSKVVVTFHIIYHLMSELLDLDNPELHIKYCRHHNHRQ